MGVIYLFLNYNYLNDVIFSTSYPCVKCFWEICDWCVSCSHMCEMSLQTGKQGFTLTSSADRVRDRTFQLPVVPRLHFWWGSCCTGLHGERFLQTGFCCSLVL